MESILAEFRLFLFLFLCRLRKSKILSAMCGKRRDNNTHLHYTRPFNSRNTFLSDFTDSQALFYVLNLCVKVQQNKNRCRLAKRKRFFTRVFIHVFCRPFIHGETCFLSAQMYSLKIFPNSLMSRFAYQNVSLRGA